MGAVGPIPQIVNPKDAKWAGHPHEHAEPDQEAFDRFRAIKCSLNEPSVHPDGHPVAAPSPLGGTAPGR